MLEKEYKYYTEHKTELLKQYQGEFIVIKDNKVIGNYTNKVEAVNDVANNKQLEIGTFLVQQVLPGECEPIQRFTSRVFV